jgi:hypothetical protein
VGEKERKTLHTERDISNYYLDMYKSALKYRPEKIKRKDERTENEIVALQTQFIQWSI